MQVNNHFKISQYEGGNYDVIGFGKDTILPHIKVGGSLWVADFVFSPLHGFEGQQNTAENYNTYLKLKGSAGETWNRRDKTFIFYAGYLSLAP